MASSRLLAYQILLHLEQKAEHTDRLIRTALERHSLMEERDRALLTEMVYGVVRWRGRLDWHINQLSRTRPEKIASPVRVLLRLALYQILFLDRVPDHAAVNEAVNIARANHPEHIVRFVNGLLREAIRQRENWKWPNEETDPAGYLATMTSHPEWFVRKIAEQIGLDEAKLFLEANNTVAPTVFRVNTLKATRLRVVQSLAGSGLDAAPSPYLLHAVRLLAPRRDITRTEAFEQGWIQAQDEASQLVTHVLDPKSEDRVLDLCSGFGIKSAHMAIFMKNRGSVFSVDNSAWKLEDLERNARRQGVEIVQTHAGDILDLAPEQFGKFDRVLLDAPCTGLGVIRRNPDIKWNRHIKDPWRMSQVQKALLSHAALFVKDGGVLVYATCSVLKDEGEAVAEFFSQSYPEFQIDPVAGHLPESCSMMVSGPYLRSWPHKHDVDGFFAARWIKRRQEVQ